MTSQPPGVVPELPLGAGLEVGVVEGIFVVSGSLNDCKLEFGFRSELGDGKDRCVDERERRCYGLASSRYLSLALKAVHIVRLVHHDCVCPANKGVILFFHFFILLFGMKS